MSDTIRNYLVQKTQRLISGVITALLAFTLLSCGSLDGLKDTVNTVDEAVALLQDIDASGTWETIADGLDELRDQKQGYSAVVQLREGAMDASGNLELPLKTDTILEIQADPAGNALLKMAQGAQVVTYFIEGYRSPSNTTRVYEVDNGQYSCVKGGEQDIQLRGGLNGVFERYALLAAGAQLLSVAEAQDEDSRIVERDATHYELESKVPDALKILEKIDNQELRQKIEQAGPFKLSGSLDIDQETGALMHFESVYDNLADQRRSEFSLEITQWGDVPNLPLPTQEQIALACP